MELNMNATATLTLVDYWHIAVRRKWLIVGAILLSVAVAGVLCVALPKSFRSSTLIMVEEQKIPADYVKAIVGGSIESRLSLIQQQVMSRTLLSGLVGEFKLYQDDVRREGMEAAVDVMRKSIKVETVGTMGGRTSRVEAFSISFAHEDPMTAMKVTAKLASQFLEENLRVREQLTQGTSEFLAQELKRAEAALETQEQAISEFKRKHMGELPQQVEANLRALDRMQLNTNSNAEELSRLTDRRTMIENAINDYEATGVINPGLGGGRGGADPLISRLKELERNLSTLSTEYKETYPDIILIKQEIEMLKAQIEETQGADAAETPIVDPYLQGLRKQRNEVKLEIGYLQDRRRRLTAQIKDYERRVENAPTREQELMILVRDYDNTQKQYQSLLDKKLNARVSENMESREKGGQFRIIDPANLPQKPDKPDRLLIMLMGLVFGCGLGMGGAVALEHLKPSFRRPEEVEMALGLPVFAATADFRLAYPKGSALPYVLREGEKAAMKPGTKDGDWSWKPGKNGAAERLSPTDNLVTKWRPLSLVSEQFRVAATRLALMVAERPHAVIVVTSAVQGEGKSSTAVNLGYVLAQDLGESNVLIDGDLKNPALHSYAAVASEPGLTDLLQGTKPLECCLQHLGELPLWIMPTGHRADRPLELSKVQQLAGILSELRTRYEYLIVDAPPILPVADMNVLAGMADILVLVVRAGSTPRDAVQQSLNRLKEIGRASCRERV